MSDNDDIAHATRLAQYALARIEALERRERERRRDLAWAFAIGTLVVLVWKGCAQ